jgi:hypothetical protein
MLPHWDARIVATGPRHFMDASVSKAPAATAASATANKPDGPSSPQPRRTLHVIAVASGMFSRAHIALTAASTGTSCSDSLPGASRNRALDRPSRSGGPHLGRVPLASLGEHAQLNRDGLAGFSGMTGWRRSSAVPPPSHRMPVYRREESLADL